MTRLARGAKCGGLAASGDAPGTPNPAEIARAAASARAADDPRDSRSRAARLPNPSVAARSIWRRERLGTRGVMPNPRSAPEPPGSGVAWACTHARAGAATPHASNSDVGAYGRMPAVADDGRVRTSATFGLE